MKFVRFSDQGHAKYGLVEDDRVKELDGSPFSGYKVTDKVHKLSAIKFLPVCQPSKVVAIGLNYKAHAKEAGAELPEEPLLFIKPSTSVIGHNDEIIYPKIVKRLDHEAELAIVIKDRTKAVEPQEAKAHILGYTCLNDVSAREIQKKDGQWARAKGFDTFCPIGPYIVDDVDPSNIRIQAILNGSVKQDSNTSDLIFGVEKLVSFISQVMTLLPGDIIATGTPAGVSPMQVGDTIEIVLDGIGTLRNTIAAA